MEFDDKFRALRDVAGKIHVVDGERKDIVMFLVMPKRPEVETRMKEMVTSVRLTSGARQRHESHYGGGEGVE
ncbi:hypothetical protein HA466_0025570 [Hirschfeldia incana]|nr:hypothetical protein HA466_0025570 [Hirschfeldia incana]